MNYEVDQEGTIAVPLSVNQALFIKKLLVSNHFQSRKERAPDAYFNEVIPIMVAVDDAINSGKKAKTNPGVPVKKIQVYCSKKTSAKHGFWESVRNFFDPPYTISDFETAFTLSGQKHFIINMDFSESERLHPYNVAGQIFFLGAWYNARWNSHGYCECSDLHPDDLRGFHLVHFDLHDTVSSGTFVLWIIGLILFLFLISTFIFK